MVRRNHLNHHKTLGSEQDQDRAYYDLSDPDRLSTGRFVRWIVMIFVGVNFLFMLIKSYKSHDQLVQKNKRSIPMISLADLVSIGVCMTILFLGLWAITGIWWTYFILWFLPILTVYAGLNGLRNCLEHANLDGINVSDRLISYVSNPVERFFIGPFNMNYHAEHHWFMSVPFFRLPALRRYLLEKGAFGGAVLHPSYLLRIKELMAQLSGSQAASTHAER